MAPTPTPTPSPLDGLNGSDGTSPSGLDEVLTDIAESADPSAIYGANLDAALNSVPRTVFSADYIPDTGLVVTVSPLVLLVTLVVGVLIAAVAVARRARRSDEPSSRARFLAERERERIAARERDAAVTFAAKAAAAEDVNR
ncbi:hypothetical protein [Mycobacteroides abscessus]|uniref:hypothetical protein n=1 Tax=Mycobacteroides abscessus TaxID=36809 RepID=UPI00092A98E8|nr:hypothetical protein [Mycobacteroides abscessus]SHP98538.1 Uncharacterised protein [Mycobacteroides abscessus subsp. abscessus]SHQ61184.1 Uncharacterised protein [Mycobacteroides abscessus subsp. abscessus]SKD63463.1 Uncharacterised protein [Mycobacteroides abscessus subsp. abscessus]SLD63091.1 Uncharacterised protein [Mycobacteroides abscessus subsp. abscessus]